VSGGGRVRPLVWLCVALAGLSCLGLARAPRAAELPHPGEADYVIKDFHFAEGGQLSELRIHYRFLGKPVSNARGQVTNAVLILHGTGGNGGNFITPEFAGEIFGAGQLLDASRYYIILPDGIGHGGSSKPSDGLHARFPQYGYRDMVQAQYRLLTEGLKVNHARLIMGTSMGGMHTWLWGELHPEFMDALMPLASLPTQISGRNRLWRRVVIDAIRNDPDWKGGEYHSQPPALKTGIEMIWLMSSNPVLRQTEMPTRAAADAKIDAYVTQEFQHQDANDMLYQVSASRDYDPAPGLSRITAPLLAVNSGDDLINPPELKILETGIKQVAHGRAVVVPYSDRTRGHGSHSVAVLWKDNLAELLRTSER
jgi:homoserine O-acetyltransferase